MPEMFRRIYFSHQLFHQPLFFNFSFPPERREPQKGNCKICSATIYNFE